MFVKRVQFNTVEKLCFTIVTRNSLGSLHVASLEAKIVRICFLGVNTGLSGYIFKLKKLIVCLSVCLDSRNFL